MVEVTKEILEAVEKAAENNRLSCPRARKLAEELKVTYKAIGDACNELKIKLYACELGCF